MRGTPRLSTEFRVGIFFIAGILALVVIALVLKGNPFASHQQPFYTLIPNAGGVVPKTQVRIAGVIVGEVLDVLLTDKGARIDMEIDAQFPIPAGSVVDVRTRGMLGDVFIEITRGHGEPLPPHAEIPVNPESSDLQTLMTNMNAIARDVKEVSANLAKVFGTQEGEQSLSDIVKNIQGITADLKDVTGSQKENMKELIAALRDSAVNISALIKRNDAKIDQIIANVDDFSHLLKSISTPENEEKINHLISSLDASSASLERILAKIERGEGTIGQLVSKDETADELNDTLKSIQDVVKPLSELRLSVSDRAEFRLANAESNDQFINELDIILQTRPDRYYMFGIVTAPYARNASTTTTTTTTLPDGTVIVDQDVDTTENVGKYRYNLQISQRFSFMGVRLGLFQSSGGFATDFYALNDRLFSSAEFSQFDGSPTPSDTANGRTGKFNLKVYGNAFITKNLFLTAGVDGLVLYEKPFPFIGAGISISDEDVRDLVGTAAAAAASGQ